MGAQQQCRMCNQEVLWGDQHLVTTPEGDGWICHEPDWRTLIGKDDEMRAGVNFDPLVEVCRILDLPTSPEWTWPRALEALRGLMAKEVPMFLTCPCCGSRHFDTGKFASHPHHTHSCQSCGLTWRPAIGPTVGVQFLPGFKNDDQ